MRDYFEILGIDPAQLLERTDAVAALRDLPKGFYVYSIWRLDGEAPEPFYIGKGKGRRLTIHLCPSTFSENTFKGRVLAKLAKSAHPPRFSIIASGLSEAGAHDIEGAAIKAIGRANRGGGPLTNLTNGGEGMSGHAAPTGADHHRSRPAIAENTEYASAADADRALGLHQGSTAYRIKQGWPGYGRPGQGPLPCRKGRRKRTAHHKARAVVADGIRYELLTDAAVALKVYPSAVHKRIRAGWPGYYFEDEGQLPRQRPAKHSKEHLAGMRSKVSNSAKPVRIDGRQFRSLSEAGKSVGLSYCTIRNRCLSADHPSYVFD